MGKLEISIAVAAAALLTLGWRPTAQAAGPVALQRPETRPVPGQAGQALQVTSSAFQPNAPMPMDQSAYGRNISPPLSWTPGPAATKAYALIVEDPDAPGAVPAVHWLAWNIPGDARALSKGVRNVERSRASAGMVQGANDHGSLGYSGARPPAGDPPHHYHFQVFALDRPMRLPPGADRGALLKALQGHVLARGELVGLYVQQPEAAASRRRRGRTPATASPDT